MIYGNVEPSEGMAVESMGNDIESKFIDEICELMINSLEISYNERRIVKPLLKKSFEAKLNNRWGKEQGLLQQYETYIVDTISERIIRDLDLPEDTKPNHDYSTHAKFSDIIKAIKVKYSIKDQRKEKIQQLGSVAPPNQGSKISP
jgi:hypothetical protein